MSLLSSLKNTLPTLKALVLSNPIKEKATTLLLKWIETLLKKALQFGFNANTLPQQPVMAALQLVSLATQAEATNPLPDKLTVAARMLYAQLPNTWKEPNGPLTESELLAVLRDGLRLSRSIQSVIQQS